MKRFGEKLRMLRKKHGLSQSALGQEIGVSQVHVAKLELGQKTPNVAMLLKLSELFDVLADMLIKDYLELP